MKSTLVATPAELTVKSIGFVIAKTSLSSLVVDQNVSYLRFLFSVSINSAPTKKVCDILPIIISLTTFPETMKLSLSVGSK